MRGGAVGVMGAEARYAEAEFNPLLFPPCACPRHRGAEGEAGEGEESAVLRQLRARVAEENGARRWVRGQG
ncbi:MULTISPECIES: hypothetical protein [Actinomycetes]|uniref:hypothetical protein n=1 Tax=Actinomycetes TaxID=1760 RepID=UPI0003C2E03C|nr:hypothetical protein [Streptomyces sp. 604F]ESP98266.1 Hypothetical protein B591_16794 [Streptomyces sp. GBA 94-10 4N24]ESQ03914.1 Hypothetical protein B590_16789 [Streptomyces sp. PVA_94-07]QPA00587.1 hypothetical protein DI273_17490 [Streptomyces violascens]RPK73720.1 hypothetical protein EES44_02215 [Streptomyces sp. ADI96-15]WDV32397.1 hypothetical protein OIM90_17090 [Streptomyces sp. AD16]